MRYTNTIAAIGCSTDPSKIMKTHLSIPLQALAASFALTLTSLAQSAVSTTTTATTTSDGMISEFSPETIIIRSESAPEPIRYSYTKTTTYVDESGAPVSLDLVRSGLPVTVSYTKEGDHMIANRVVVHKKTTTSSSGGVVEDKRSTTVVSPAPAVEEKRTTTTTTTTK